MFAHRCVRCRHWWSSTANPDLHRLIVTFCPECIPKVMYVMDDEDDIMLYRRSGHNTIFSRPLQPVSAGGRTTHML